MAPVRAVNFRDLERRYSVPARLRARIRSGVIGVLSLKPRRGASREWIRFPFYHHVFDDERRGFERQLRYMKRLGDFIRLDDAVAMLERREAIGGRYFCVSFDDGFKNCLANAVPILATMGCPAAFFVPTDFIGCDLEADWEVVRPFFAVSRRYLPMPVEFLTWDDCRQMVEAGMTIGSHTRSHARLSRLDPERLAAELTGSKQRIEAALGRPCVHFACPWGRPGHDFRPDADPAMARHLGYRSFLTTRRGPNGRGDDPLAIRRDHLLAGYGLHQLRYFFARPR